MRLSKFICSVCACLIIAQPGHSGLAAEPDIDYAEQVLEFAQDIGSWLAASAQSDDRGTSWPDDVLNPQTVSYDLASGVAGKVLFFVALYNATGDTKYLGYAEQGADYLVDQLQDSASLVENGRRASLYSGVSGIGVALMSVHSAAPQQRYRDAVSQVVELLADWNIGGGSGAHWSDEFNDLLYGEAGTILFLAYVADEYGDERALALARSGAQFLLEQAQSSEGNAFWYFRRGRSFNLPNFSHGTAGTGYVLATLASRDANDVFRQAAADGFHYLNSKLQVEDELIRIPYGWGSDSWDGLYEFGWAHGLAGTALFYERLLQAGIDVDFVSETSAYLRHTLLNINLPGTPDAPFAEPSTPLDLRFGRAGVLALMSEWSRTDETVRPTRDAIWKHIRDAAIRGENGIHWEVDAPAFMGGGRAAYTGYLHGAAGIGLAILKLHASLVANEPYVVMPDDPFSWRPREN